MLGVVLVHIYRLSLITKDFHSLAEKKPVINVLSEVTKRKTVDSYCFIITVFQNATIFTFCYVLNTIKGYFKTM